ncbi:hypothetical protein F2Q65_18870 [Thiohalocapsa marina]|uniref:Uncharacterized protein n=1 Tax=Thiohalocapsa marina TaxID=424902 RepID=A0A5M8FAS0_9GAMM|nr:hypothetical protein [Thiohalocapsa marina]KAA6181769.1 hypothetical protein F2Q65_18870 [Thiohalocapsa marina]
MLKNVSVAGLTLAAPTAPVLQAQEAVDAHALWQQVKGKAASCHAPVAEAMQGRAVTFSIVAAG